jgi:hypothetical protein
LVSVDPYSHPADKNELKRAVAKNRQPLRTPPGQFAEQLPRWTQPRPTSGLSLVFYAARMGQNYPLMSRWQMTAAMIYGYGFHI